MAKRKAFIILVFCLAALFVGWLLWLSRNVTREEENVFRGAKLVLEHEEQSDGAKGKRMYG